MTNTKRILILSLFLLVIGNVVYAACKPVCKNVGTRSEGWYDSCTGELIKPGNCSNCKVVCDVTSEGEGWYSVCGDKKELIVRADCMEENESLPNVIKCPESLPRFCPNVYEPVCAYFITSTGDIKKRTMPNYCVACLQGAYGYVNGECNESSNYQAICVRTGVDSYTCKVIGGKVYNCKLGDYNCSGYNVKKVLYNGKIYTCVPRDCIIAITSSGCVVRCGITNTTVMCHETNVPGIYKCTHFGRIYTCSLNKTLLEGCEGAVISKVLRYDNKTLYCLPPDCRVRITPAGECFVECLVYALNESTKPLPRIPSGLMLEDKIRKCVLDKVRQGINKTEAIKECTQKYKEDIISVVSNLTEQQLAIYTHCLTIPEETKNKILSLIREIRELKREKVEKIKEISENCSKNETTQSCGQEISNVTKYYNERIQELTREIVNLTRNVTISVNTTCLQEKLYKLENVTGVQLNVTVQPANLTQAQKRYVIQRAIGKKLIEEIRRNPKMIKQILAHKELRSALLTEMHRNKTLLREVLKNKEARKEIIKEIATNKTMRKAMLRSIIRDRKLRRLAIRELLRNKEIKKELLQNKTLLAEILPPKLKLRLQKLKFVDINVTERGNNTIYIAKTVRTGRLLGIIPVTITEDVEFNDTAVISERRPWWAFLVFG